MQLITMDDQRLINKSMDRDDLSLPEAKVVVDELNALVREMRAKNVPISAWYGGLVMGKQQLIMEKINRGYNYEPLPDAADDHYFPWFLYWEIVWVVLNNDFSPGCRVLDLGGSSSLFSYYLASKSCDVTTVDLNKELVENGNAIAERLGWKMRNLAMDIRDLAGDDKYDHITSICVYEHIPLKDRVSINQHIAEKLNDGGHFSITFDYRNPSRFVSIDSPEDVRRQFIEPSSLKVRGNEVFHDNGKNYLLHPFYYNRRLWGYKWEAVKSGDFALRELLRTKDHEDYTFGALFQEKS
jgi:2-polyprenyl-3-methyl-5-hydroxy-6-metoxy-1,4-benzoquinol methylase